jgi:hypothetical protein
MHYEASDDNDISYTDSDHMDPDSNTMVEPNDETDSTDQCILPPADSNSLSTQSSNSANTSQTRHTNFSTSNSTQTTVQMSSVASMVSDTRIICPTSTHQ